MKSYLAPRLISFPLFLLGSPRVGLEVDLHDLLVDVASVGVLKGDLELHCLLPTLGVAGQAGGQVVVTPPGEVVFTPPGQVVFTPPGWLLLSIHVIVPLTTLYTVMALEAKSLLQISCMF